MFQLDLQGGITCLFFSPPKTDTFSQLTNCEFVMSAICPLLVSPSHHTYNLNQLDHFSQNNPETSCFVLT
jgi:hypothetical protein